jgi:hypothetical protein
MKRAIQAILIISFTALSLHVFAQDDTDREERDVIQLSGVVVVKDSTMGIPGVHVYVPKNRRGTSANQFGYFSFPVLEGDSIIFSAVGFRKKHLIVPDLEEDKLTVIIPLYEDTTFLEEVEILPYPTEELFKEAILAMQLPNQGDLDNMSRNLDPAILAEMYRNMPMDGSMNHRYFTQMQSQYWNDNASFRPNPLLNPFAWGEFFRSLKKKK